MQKKPIIQSLWIGAKLSQIEQLCIASFIHHGHQFHLYTYGKVAGVPESVQIKDANKIIPEQEIFTTDRGYAHFADWFRWQLLYQKGGFWVDMDMVALKPFEFEEEIIFGYQDKWLINIAVLRFPPKHKLCKFLADAAQNPNKLLPYDSAKDKKSKIIHIIKEMIKKIIGKNGDWKNPYRNGPDNFTLALKHFNLASLAKSAAYFYPVTWQNCGDIFDEKFADNTNLLQNSYAIHLWNEALKWQSIDKNASFPQKSLFEQLKAKYNIKNDANYISHQKLVSVYMPTKNRLDLATRAIQSVLRQTYKNIELIVVDDGSEIDQFKQLKANFKGQKSIIFLSNKKSLGACESRNKAIKSAKGEFITGLDDDDYFTDEKRISYFVNAWEHLENKASGLFDTSTTITPNGKNQWNKKLSVSRDDLKNVNHIGCQIFAPTKAFTAAGLFDSEMPAWQDWDLWFRMAAENKPFININKNTYLSDMCHNFDRISEKPEAQIRLAKERLSAKMLPLNLYNKAGMTAALLAYPQVKSTPTEFALSMLFRLPVRLKIIIKRIVFGAK